jgi:3-oxoacyl-(acyl-carrier-protein) synthase
MGQSKLPLAFTGMGVVSAAGLNCQATEARLFNDTLTDHCDPSEARYFKLALNTAHDFAPNVLALLAAEEALAQAQLEREQLATLRVGVCVGSTAGCTNFQEDFGRAYFAGELPDPAPFEQYFHNNTAQFLARKLGLRGPVQMLSNACTSGADAIGVAAQWLRADLCDVVLCGGSEWILPRIYYGFRSMMLCSPQNCKPFDRQRQGLTLGEGAGMLVLEKPSTARAVRGRLLGYGCASDAYHPTAPDPEARGLDLAVRHALNDISLDQVDFINSHATGTPHNDLAEGRWLSRKAVHAPIVASKGYTGHTLGAAGAIEAVLTLLSLQCGILPASLGFSEFDPEVGVSPTTQRQTGDYQTALSLSLGFGGINSALLLGREA